MKEIQMICNIKVKKHRNCGGKWKLVGVGDECCDDGHCHSFRIYQCSKCKKEKRVYVK